jgi:hypothetical protein
MTGRKTAALSDMCRAALSRRRRVRLPAAEARTILERSQNVWGLNRK